LAGTLSELGEGKYGSKLPSGPKKLDDHFKKFVTYDDAERRSIH